MKKKLLGSIAAGTIALSLLGTGVYAGTVISTYKTVRGDFATVEKEEVHKNRIAFNIDDKQMKTKSWYANGVTYVPMREAAEMLGATVTYDSKTQTADITSKKKHPELEIISENNLPYSVEAYGLLFTINKIKADKNGITFNVTATNKSTIDASLNNKNWMLYGNNKSINNLGTDEFLYNHGSINKGETVTGDIYFNSLPADVDVLTLDLSLWAGYTHSDFLLRFKVNN